MHLIKILAAFRRQPIYPLTTSIIQASYFEPVIKASLHFKKDGCELKGLFLGSVMFFVYFSHSINIVMLIYVRAKFKLFLYTQKFSYVLRDLAEQRLMRKTPS